MHFLPPAELHSIGARELDELLGRRELVVAYGDGELRGLATAALLFADYAVLHRGARLVVDRAEAWAAAIWRLGRCTTSWAVRGAPAEEIADAITDLEPQRWVEEWMRHRSVLSLDAAATLIRSRGGDRLERAEFGRLFAAGEPRKGLGAFLAKATPSW